MRTRWLMAVTLSFGLTGVSSAADNQELASQARVILKRYCYGCHSGPGSTNGYVFDVLKVATLTTGDSENPAPLVAGKSADSSLYERLASNTMPPKTIKDRPSEAEREIVKAWIDAGAPEFPSEAGRKFVTPLKVMSAIRDHIAQTPQEARRFQRYFTLDNIRNNPVYPDADLRLYQAALSKAINSLSGKGAIALPEVVPNSEETVFSIDVRRFDWDRDDQWSNVMKAYPYGLKFRREVVAGSPYKGLKEVEEAICKETSCDMPYVRADWFISTAIRPPLYNKMLRIPDTATELEKTLGVRIAENYENDKLARAGFSKSGVSAQNRMVERHEGDSTFYYWKSYDFKPGVRRSKLTRFPLGPENLFDKNKHPFRDQAFIHDGGEVIYSLQNGLQAYMLVDGENKRIDEGPIVVVNDSQKISGNPTIVNGISCMFCHKHGMIPFSDEIRDNNALFSTAQDKVNLLYPDKAKMTGLIKTDEDRFMIALNKTIGKFLKVGADKDKDIKSFAEPIGEVARTYRLDFLDLKMIGYELGIENPDVVLRKLGDKRLKQLGLEGLFQPGGLISRADWETIDGYSLMQEVAKDLGATPVEFVD